MINYSHRFRILLAILLISIQNLSYSQTLDIIVIDGDTREILVGAKIVVIGNKMDSIIEVRTNNVGMAHIKLPGRSVLGTEVDITASMPKYLSDNTRYMPSGGRNDTINFVFKLKSSRISCGKLPSVGYELGKMEPVKGGLEEIKRLIKVCQDNPNLLIRLVFHYSPEEDHGSGISKARADFVKRQFALAGMDPTEVGVLIMLDRRSEMGAEVVGYKNVK